MQLSLVSTLLLVSTVTAATAPKPGFSKKTTLEEFTYKTSTAVLEDIVKRASARGSKSEEELFNFLFKRLTGAGFSPPTSPKAESFRKFLSAIKKEDIQTHGPMMVHTVGRFLDSFAKANEKAVYNYIGTSPTTIVKALRQFRARTDVKKHLSAISPSWLKVAHREMIVELQTATIGVTPVLTDMPVSFWTAMMGMKPEEQVEMCRILQHATFNSLSKDKLKLLTPVCIAATNIAADAGFTAEKVKALKDDAFSTYEGAVHVDSAKGLRGVQLKSFAAKAASGDRCTAAHLPLHAVSSDAIKEIDAVCLANYMLSTGAQPLGKLWEKIPSNVFESLPSSYDNATLASKLNPDDKKYCSSKLTQFFKYSKVAANLPADGEFNKNAKIEIDPKKLAKVADKNVFAKVITNKELPDDILAYIDASYFTNVYAPRGSNTLSGIQVLDLIVAPNKAKIISLLSSKIATGQQHACTLIDGADTLESCKAIKQYASDKCLASLGFRANKEEILKNPMLAASVPFNEISDKFESADYEKMKMATLAGLVRGNFCSVVTQVDFDKLPLDALSAVDSNCLSNLSVEVAADKMTRFIVRVFENVTASTFAERKLTLANVSDKQLPFLSASVDPSKSVIATFTEGDIKILDKRVTHLTAKQIAQLSEKAVAKISPSNITPEALTMVSPAQIKALVPAFNFMNAAQVEKLGAENGKSVETMKIIGENATSFNKEAFAAWEKRRGETDAANEGWGAIVYCCIAGGVVLVIAIGFFGYRKFAATN